MTTNTTAPIKAPFGIVFAMITLGMGGLFIGTGEFVSMSLLPSLAAAMQVSVPEAGSYISAYALGVVVGAPLIAIAAAKWPKKLLLISLMVLFAVGYVFSAIAWDHYSLLIARFIGGLPHGAYYGIACLVAAAMVPENKKAQAAGYVMVGLAAANVIGVPIATWLGQLFGWRITFGFLAIGGAITMGLFWLFLPAVPKDKHASIASELSGLKNLQVWLTLLTAAIGFGGMFAIYSYITPTLTEVSGFTEQQVPMILSLWGTGMVLGNLVGGWLADKGLIRAIYLIMIWNVVFLALFALFANSKFGALVTLFLIGGGFALVPALQVRLMDVAGKAQTLAAALNHSAFNISNAIGASLGGVVISAGYGWASTGWVASLLAIIGILLMLFSMVMDRRKKR
ncbi:MFS transporter [uncultured Pseudoalteromonas sp.]|uniref:MFS transporter n=1 Tax=uncultured Pseudoalteromonas sp. TaxID=114053 RepID=UPI002629A9E7|nr:MFS transporter [uncultured Pseudoalteromonas sp.]